MTREEKVALSSQFDTAYAFRQGLFMRLYEASLCWFVQHVRPLKIMVETTRQGERLLYGGLPLASFDAVAAEQVLPELRATPEGYAWSCRGDSVEALYETWRKENLEQALLLAPPAKKRAEAVEKEVLDLVRAFGLIRATPLDAMMAVARWQALLRESGKEGA